MRATFKTWAGEESHHPRDVVERALAHQLPNQTEAAYAATLFASGARLPACSDSYPVLTSVP